MSGEPAVLRGPDELTSEWLARALGTGTVSGFEVEPIGTGQMSESCRVSLAYASGRDAGPSSVVLKTASVDRNSRTAGVGLGVYEREVRFYRELAPRIRGPLADCHFAGIAADGSFTIVLEDLSPAAQG